MRVINGLLYIAVFALSAAAAFTKEEGKFSKWVWYIKKHMHILFLLLLVNSVSFGLTFQKKDSQIYVEKEGFGGEEQQIDLLLEKGDTTEQVTLQVRPMRLTDEEQKEKMEEAFSYFDKHLKGNNKSLSKVTMPLKLTLDYESYPFDVDFVPEDCMLIDDEGNLRNSEEELLAAGYGKQDLKKGIVTHITITLWYGEESREKTYELTLYPEEADETEELFARLKQMLRQKEAKALYQEGFTIPSQSQGVQITRLDEERITAFHVLLIGFIFAGLLVMREKENEKKKEQHRRDMLIRCYPWFVNEMVLLMGAGMQVKNIFQMLLEEYEKEDKQGRRQLMEELKLARHSMELGVPEEQVYYQLGRRLKLPCYIKLMTLLEQNVKKGGKGLTAMFEQEELAALEERKSLAKRYGEEAGTKLLGPMILLLLVIMLIIMVPAYMSFL